MLEVDYRDLLNTKRFNNLLFNLSVNIDSEYTNYPEWQEFVNYMKTVSSQSLSKVDVTLPEDSIDSFWYSSEYNNGITEKNIENIVLLIDKLMFNLPKEKVRPSLTWYSSIES